MRIAVNTRFLLSKGLTGFGVYTHEIMRRMVNAHSDDSFAFCFDRKFDGQFIYGNNVEGVSLYPPARHVALFMVWYQMRLKSFVNRWEADVLFSPDSFMPLGQKTPTVITVHDVAYKRFPEMVPRLQKQYYEKFMPRFIDEAAHIITVSEFSKKEICHFFDVDPDKVSAIHNGVGPEFKPRSEEEKQGVRGRYSEGKPFLLYVGAIHPRKNVATLIRAFELYKNETQSELQLVIAGQQNWHAEDVKQVFESSSYKDDIRFLGHVAAQDLPLLVGSARAMVYVSLYEGFGLPVVESLASGVPVIVSSSESTGAVLTEVGGDAVIQVDPTDVSSIAGGISSIVEDQSLWESLATRSVIRAKEFNWNAASEKTYDILRRTAE